MHASNIEILRKEAFRLVELEIQLLKKIQDVPGLLSNGDDSDIQSFDAKSLAQCSEVLAGERAKLDSMDMVVAVVGTMKAGKSTTINAIVGSEILPNRNGPMTSIPTLIRHTDGKKEPSLTFSNNAPINKLCSELYKVFKSKPGKVRELCQESSDMAAVIDFVEQGNEVKSYYEGQYGIFDFLKIVNDIVRICRELEVDFPFSDYDEMHELPVIEVEFTSLSQKEAGLGKLTLLDTPGPNEAGQKHLKFMLRDQLRKASAVIAVLNYTQLKSESDEELRNEVNAIANIAKGRLYAFVNKFDQRTHNDPDEKSVKRMVSNLLDNTIPEDSIFAVSAQQAFLGEVIQKYIHENGVLPDPNEEPWVEEFARDCFGRRWQAEIMDLEKVLVEARGYWLDSGFSEPLEKVVHTAHENSAYYALESTSSKLVSLAERISNFVNSRETALNKTTIELQKHIDLLKNDEGRVSVLRRSKENDALKLFKELNISIDKCLKETQKEAERIVEKLFKEGLVEQEVTKSKAQKMTQSERDRAGVISTSDQKKKRVKLQAIMEPTIDRKREKKQFDASKRVIEFSKNSEANKFIGKIESALQVPTKRLNENMSLTINEAINGFKNKLENEIAQEAGDILNEVSHRLGDDGFDIDLKVPSSVNSSIFTLRSMMISEGVRAESKTVTRLREQSSFFGGIKRVLGGWLSKDWGYDEYETNIKVFKVALDDLDKKTKGVIREQVSNWRSEAEKEVEKPVNNSLSNFFDELEKKIESIRGDLLQGIADKVRSKDEQAELLGGLKKMARDIPGMREDTGHLHDDTYKHLEERLQ